VSRLDPEVEGEEEKPKSPCLRRIELLRQMIKNGLEAEAASLTLVDGIGSVWARKLLAADIRSLQELYSTPTDKVVALGGVSEKRAAAWISEALLHASTDALGDSPCRGMVAVHPSTLQLGVDPYRLRRAVELKVLPKDPKQWTVSGGLDPHLVGYTSSPSSNERILFCDCPDHAKGHTCKHILAVRLAQGDKELFQAVLDADEARQETFLDLFHLWFSR
jgi:helicase